MNRLATISILVLLILVFYSCNRNKTIRGDKNIITKEISIGEYNEIKLSGSMNIFYIQNDSIPTYLSLEIDSNLVEYIHIEVDDETLRIGDKKGYNTTPSKFTIHTNSKYLKEISIGGSGSVTGKGKLKTQEFEIEIAGNGDVKFDSIEVQSSKIKIAGSGNVLLSGTATTSKYAIAGSGNINTKELVQDTVECKIAGSGNIEVNAKEQLINSIAGSGDIKYVGNPKISNSIAGSGNVKPIN